MPEGMKQLKVMGHPAHVPLTHFPLALWTAGFGGDVAYFWRSDPFWWNFAFWSIAVGLGLGSLTLLTGFYDYLFIPEKKPTALNTATLHMLVMLSAACLFTASLYFHRGEVPPTPHHQMLALVLSGAGTLFLHCGGWLGGQLVYHFGVGSDGK